MFQVNTALKGQENIVECTYVDLQNQKSSSLPLDDVQGARFFSTPVTLGVDGIERINNFQECYSISDREREDLDKMLPILKKQIEKGIKFAKKYKDDVEYENINQSHKNAQPILISPNQGQVAK